MLIIPAIDVLGNKVVRLTKGDYQKATFYDSTPLEMAKRYESIGFKWIHLVDLAAAKDGQITILPIIQEIKSNTNLKIEFGGGIRHEKHVDELLKKGVDRIIIGSLSVDNKNEFEKIINKFDKSKFIVAIDSNKESILTKGWTENSGVTIYDHIGYCTDHSINTFLCTDVSKDGTLSGPNGALYTKILKKYPDVQLIASGGISSLHDIIMLQALNMHGAVVGKAIYENKIRLEDLASFGS